MIDWHQILGMLAGLVACTSYIPYIKDILHGTTRPNVVSYALWSLLLGISIFAQARAGTSWSIIFLMGNLVGTSAVTILCLRGYGYKKYGRLEWVCTGCALIAIIFWQVTKEPLVAIVLAIITHFMASVPTLAKTYRDPWSEVPVTWFMVAFAAALSIVSTTIFNLPNLLYPFYLLLINAATGMLASAGRHTRQTV